jgi:ribosomal protein S18 acetylase RimI-like enzyme
VISGRDDTPWVGVRADWRRRGLASALLRHNHARLWEYGVRTASLWTILENPTGSVALYESLGYRITERQPRYRKPFSPTARKT